LIVRGDLDVASSINYSVEDWLNVGLAFDDLDAPDVPKKKASAKPLRLPGPRGFASRRCLRPL
jgi:hypothetical protein